MEAAKTALDNTKSLEIMLRRHGQNEEAAGRLRARMLGPRVIVHSSLSLPTTYTFTDSLMGIFLSVVVCLCFDHSAITCSRNLYVLLFLPTGSGIWRFTMTTTGQRPAPPFTIRINPALRRA